MIFKRKTMRRDEWTGIEEKSFADMRVDNEWLSGRAGLLRMEKTEKPFYVNAFGRKVQITGDGYTWLQLAPEGENYWATVMFDEMGRLFECYFDITYENHVLENSESWFCDLILDVLMAPDGNIMRLDNQELEEALKNGLISENTYGFALDAQEKLLKKLTGRETEFFGMCIGLRNTLYEKLNQR